MPSHRTFSTSAMPTALRGHGRVLLSCLREAVRPILIYAAIFSCGCQQRPAAPVVKGPNNVEDERDASLAMAAETLRQATELPHFSAALNHMNGPLAKHAGAAPTHFDDKTRQLVEGILRANPSEMEYIEAALMRPLDAAYLQSCFLFRDAARALEVAGSSPLDQAVLGCSWVMRRVLLHEQQDEGLPPHLVLQRGFGDARDRALVVAELLRQWQIDCCLVTVPSKDGGESTLLGIILPKKDGVDMALFDPRLGLPVAGPQGIATWAEIRAKPELLPAGGIAAAQVKQAAARPACSISALAPRMKATEELLRGHEQVHLHYDIAELERRCGATELTLAGWPVADKQAPGQRALRFYGKEEGGIDTEQRFARYAISTVLPSAVMYRYEQMKVLTNLPPDARDTLTKGVTANLFQRYLVEPRLALLRGRHEDAIKRVDRIGNVIEDAAFAAPIHDTAFNQQIAQWRDRVKDAYLAGEQKAKQIWTEDQYLLALLQPDDSIHPQKLERKMLSQIVLRACREPLGNQADGIKAACWEDRAAKLEAQSEARRQTGKQGGSQEAISAWKNARSAWAKFHDRAALTPAQLRVRIESINAVALQGQRDVALSLCDQLHLDLHHALHARQRLAEANRRLNQPKLAVQWFTELRDDLTALEKYEQPRKFLQDFREQVRGQTHQLRRVDLLLRDWTPDGHLAALRQSVERRLESLK